ncbi:hypothetical protein CPU12_07805 [Malaciobacter molluscorum LMG 25693]|uniref:Membrane protein n=1 Tax=Malaciobacter molluscorum LMG 25693 TaxID=870501 RepID=A0A2G1DHL1_9BACT|nr:hypothetical protein [Malaciobacter molluscorum]AXX93338.1 putative membrane protein [Malaciobacter molluscorum LMG 25693]PHO17992.1 hypothetical protein CPU12_07805 [Malaciobacter molluscorum LMG 25693]RXJ95146.1 hypothetical protein CRV00_05165 [Malaciobacter molluscorum]
MKKVVLFICIIMSLFGYLFSCFLAKIGGDLPLVMTKESYKYIFLNPLAISFSLIGFFIGVILCLLIIKIINKFRYEVK